MDLEVIQTILVAYFSTQIGYASLVLLLGSIVTDYYDYIFWEKQSNLFMKSVKAISFFFFGAGPYLDKKFRRYSFIKRKLYLLGCILLMIIASVIIFYGLTAILKPFFK